MPTPTKGPRLGGSPAHQKAILSNLATSLFEHGAITTTEAKARRLRPFAERLITKAKRGDLHNRRQVLSVIRDKTVVHVLFTEIGPRYAERPGGYTRITKIGPRKGDNAPMAVIELVNEEFTPKVRSTGGARGATAAGSSAASQAAPPSAAQPAPEPPPQSAPEPRHRAQEPAEGDAPTEEASATEAPAQTTVGTDPLADETASGVDSATMDPNVPAPGAIVEPRIVEATEGPTETTGGEGESAATT